MNRRRWWLCTNLSVEREIASTSMLATTPTDDEAIAALRVHAYAGSIDDDPSHFFVKELRTWRRVDDADVRASRVALGERGAFVGACLIGREFGLPLLYEIATPPLDPAEARAVYAEIAEGDIQDLPTWLLARAGSL